MYKALSAFTNRDMYRALPFSSAAVPFAGLVVGWARALVVGSRTVCLEEG